MRILKLSTLIATCFLAGCICPPQPQLVIVMTPEPAHSAAKIKTVKAPVMKANKVVATAQTQLPASSPDPDDSAF